MARISVARSLHDVGLAVWCGGALMGAVGLNGAASTLDDPTQRGRATNNGWKRWAPVNAAAIGAHLVGGALIVKENRSRVSWQQGVAGWTAAKTVLTGAALGATAATAFYGPKVWAEGDVHVTGATEASPSTPPEAAAALSRLKYLQWAIPALTAAIVVSNATMGDQQRPLEVVKGGAKRVGSKARDAAVSAVHS